MCNTHLVDQEGVVLWGGGIHWEGLLSRGNGVLSMGGGCCGGGGGAVQGGLVLSIRGSDIITPPPVNRMTDRQV